MAAFNPAKITNTKHAQGVYPIKHIKKYKGSKQPIFRSSWERDFMVTCDLNPAILEWDCEPFSIPYTCPLEGKTKNYWPDFLIRYIGADKREHTQLIEIKPYKQTNPNLCKSKRDKAICYVNMSKWKFAYDFCQKNGIEFKVLTERDLYGK